MQWSLELVPATTRHSSLVHLHETFVTQPYSPLFLLGKRRRRTLFFKIKLSLFSRIIAFVELVLDQRVLFSTPPRFLTLVCRDGRHGRKYGGARPAACSRQLGLNARRPVVCPFLHELSWSFCSSKMPSLAKPILIA
jgi:hypothetical protein